MFFILETKLSILAVCQIGKECETIGWRTFCLNGLSLYEKRLISHLDSPNCVGDSDSVVGFQRTIRYQTLRHISNEWVPLVKIRQPWAMPLSEVKPCTVKVNLKHYQKCSLEYFLVSGFQWNFQATIMWKMSIGITCRL